MQRAFQPLAGTEHQIEGVRGWSLGFNKGARKIAEIDEVFAFDPGLERMG